MRLFILCSLFLWVSSFAQAQEGTRLSPQARIFLEKVKQDGSMPPGYIYKKGADNTTYLSAMLQVANPSVAESFTALGVKVGTKAGNIWTVQIPVNKINDIISLTGITYLQLDEPVHATLDSARKLTRADSVQQGLGNLPSAFLGTNVVVGIIDAGFDYRHPSLFDTSGNNYRVKKVWEQQTQGTPPAGFAYGTELTAATDMWTKGYDLPMSHGAHVGGIAAGSGYGSNNNTQFRGMAPGADLVLVGITPSPSNWTSTGMTDIIDAMNYIFGYAGSVGKPAVANLSWGCSIGPHDGLSLFSQACDNLTGPGRIFVCSAGNNGGQNLHLQKNFTTADTALHSFVTFNSFLGAKKTWVDAWGDSSNAFCVQLSLFANGSKTDSTGFICLDDLLHNFALVGADNDTLFASIVTAASDFNGKPRIFLDIHNKSADAVLLSVKGTDGRVHAWSGFVENTTGYYADFVSNGYPWATHGNTNSTIGDMASTKSALAVGAYSSRVNYTNISNGFINYSFYAAKGNTAPFSSKGPTTDGRIKPDISAPGLVIGSAVNSYDPAFLSAGGSYSSVVHQWTDPQNSRQYAHAMLMGTSMSSPAAAGIVALMLEANPALSPQQVKEALAQTAIKDNFTGIIPAQGSNIWGAGKINAMGAVDRALTLSGIGSSARQPWATVFPNPARNYFIISYDSRHREDALITVADVLGREVLQETQHLRQGANEIRINAQHWAKGMYIVSLRCSGKVTSGKVFIDPPGK